MQDILMECRELDFSYSGGIKVFSKFNFVLERGARIALGGPNGSGKSTLFSLLLGLSKPDAGEISAFGKVRRTEKEFFEVRARSGLLFQNSEEQLFCSTVAEDVAFGPFNLGLARSEVHDRVEESLKLVGLEGYGNRISYRLSGGEKKLVAFACILAMKPEVLLLDEPFAGLDENYTGRVREIIAGFGASLVIVSHEANMLEGLCNTEFRLSLDRKHS